VVKCHYLTLLSRISALKKRRGGGWRKLHNEELHKLCSSPNIIKVIKSRRMRWVEHVVCIRKMRNSYKIFDTKTEKQKPFQRPQHRWKDNTMNLKN
jgi:hypothetical protein